MVGRSCRPPKEAGATNRLRQAGTQFLLAVKLRGCFDRSEPDGGEAPRHS